VVGGGVSEGENDSERRRQGVSAESVGYWF